MKRIYFTMSYDGDPYNYIQNAIETMVNTGATWAREFEFKIIDEKEVTKNVRSQNADEWFGSSKQLDQ